MSKSIKYKIRNIDIELLVLSFLEIYFVKENTSNKQNNKRVSNRLVESVTSTFLLKAKKLIRLHIFKLCKHWTICQKIIKTVFGFLII